jgi:Spy/CpxP family protein refolding chaperone
MTSFKKTSSLLLASACLAFTFAGCAETKSDKKLDQKIQQEAPVSSGDQISVEAKQLIMNSSSLTADQKQQLLTLQHDTHVKMDAYREESLKLRAILVQDVAAPSYNPKEVDQVKKRMRKVESARLSVLFDSIEQANKILGRDIPQRTNVMNDMWEEHGRF